MDGDSLLQTGDSGMVFAQPLHANFQGAGDRPFILQQRIKIATLAEIHDLFAVALDPIRLSGDDFPQGSLGSA